MPITWTQEQLDELAEAGRCHPPAGVRVRALVFGVVARGQTGQRVVDTFGPSANSVCRWVGRYREQGLAGFEIAPGRGRPAKVDEKDLETHALQSPRTFDIGRSGWSLKLPAETVPSLRGFTPAGAQQVLKRCDIHYKRGQAWALSPDSAPEAPSS